jgi:hypothetical protein
MAIKTWLLKLTAITALIPASAALALIIPKSSQIRGQ